MGLKIAFDLRARTGSTGKEGGRGDSVRLTSPVARRPEPSEERSWHGVSVPAGTFWSEIGNESAQEVTG